MIARSGAGIRLGTRRQPSLPRRSESAPSACVKAAAEIKEAEATKAEAANEMKGAMDRVEGVHGLNKQAIKVLVKFSKMNDAKKSDYLRTLLPGLEAMLPSQLDLFADTAPKDEEVIEDGEQAGAPPSGAPLQ